MWTLVGAGIKNVKQSAKLMSDVLPKECVHFPHKVAEFDPEASQVTLTNGQVVRYCFQRYRYNDNMAVMFALFLLCFDSHCIKMI